MSCVYIKLRELKAVYVYTIVSVLCSIEWSLYIHSWTIQCTVYVLGIQVLFHVIYAGKHKNMCSKSECILRCVRQSLKIVESFSEESQQK